jgi:hypothetical protein
MCLLQFIDCMRSLPLSWLEIGNRCETRTPAPSPDSKCGPGSSLAVTIIDCWMYAWKLRSVQMNALCSPSATSWFNLTSFNDEAQSPNQTLGRSKGHHFSLRAENGDAQHFEKETAASASDKFPLDFARALASWNVKCRQRTKSCQQLSRMI